MKIWEVIKELNNDPYKVFKIKNYNNNMCKLESDIIVNFSGNICFKTDNCKFTPITLNYIICECEFEEVVSNEFLLETTLTGLGIQIKDAHGNSRSVYEVLNELHGKWTALIK